MNLENEAKAIYSKIDISLRENKINRYELAEKLEVSKQCISDNLLKLKDGKFPKIEFIIKIQEALNIKIIFFNI